MSIIIQLVGLLYIIMMAVASVNLGINVTKQNQSDDDIQTVKLAYDRLNSLSVNLVLMRTMINVANGYEPDESLIIKDRFETYKHF